MSASKDKRGPSPTRPLKPKLAANAAKYKSGPAPKLAAHLSPSSTSSPPVSRALSTVTSDVFQTPRSDGSASPVKSLTDNVTPRSSPRSARKSRADSTILTPLASADPNTQGLRTIIPRDDNKAVQRFTSPSGSETWSSVDVFEAANGLRQFHTPSALSGAQPPYSSQRRQSTSQNSDTSTSFFRANESQPRKDVSRPPLRSKTSTFLHANGEEEQDEEDNSSISRDSVKSGTADKAFAKSPPSINSNLASQRPAPQVSRPFPPNNASSSPRQMSFDASPRKTSLDGPFSGHMKSLSSDSTNKPVIATPLAAEFPRPPSTSTRDPSRESYFENGAPLKFAPRPTTSPEPTSPIKAMGSPLGFPGDSSTGNSAAEARRERKLLDLEISNSSLLAINRSLEREVRKQKAELRRYRRLTRTSAGAAILSKGRKSGTSWFGDETDDAAGLGIFGESDQDLDELMKDLDNESDDSEENDVDVDGNEDNEDFETEDGPTSARTRRSDARRLRLDLTAHKELLIDSQKLNLSLRRCLGMSEQLISEGQKALAEQVRVSEVQWGGRVLHQDDHGEDDHEGEGQEEKLETEDDDDEPMQNDTALRWLSGSTWSEE